MDAEQARHERLIEIAAKAHRHSVAVNFARAVHSLYSADKPKPDEMAEIDSAESACVSADKALSDWQERHAR